MLSFKIFRRRSQSFFEFVFQLGGRFHLQTGIVGFKVLIDRDDAARLFQTFFEKLVVVIKLAETIPAGREMGIKGVRHNEGTIKKPPLFSGGFIFFS